MATIKLFESWLQSQAINEVGPAGGIDFSGIEAWDESLLAAITAVDPVVNMFYEKLKVMFKKNGILFSCTQEKAAAYMTYWIASYYKYYNKLGWSVGTADKWLLPQATSKINLNASPDNPALVLTTGQFTEFAIEEPADDSQSSDYAEIAKFCNNSSLVLLSKTRMSQATAGGYLLSVDANGSLTWKLANDYSIKLYGTSTTSSAMSQGAIKTTTWEVPATGKTIVKKLPGTMFATGSATLSDSKELDSAIAELKALLTDKNTKLAKIEVEASASGDRPAADGKTGYPANHPKGTPYIAKTAAESGNATLAFGRADAIKAKLASLGVPTTTKAIIQDGGDAAQYAKLTVTVQKADKPAEVLSKADLETILLKPKSTTDLKSTFTLSQWAATTNL